MVTITGLQQTYKYALQVCNKNQITSWVHMYTNAALTVIAMTSTHGYVYFIKGCPLIPQAIASWVHMYTNTALIVYCHDLSISKHVSLISVSIIPQAKQCQGLGIYMRPRVNTHILDILNITGALSNLEQKNSHNAMESLARMI